MTFTEIDMKTWPRAAEYRFFSQTAATELSVTVDVDVTKLLETCHATSTKFTPVFLWLVTDRLNKEPAFRMAIKEDKLGIYDQVHPAFPLFHEDDKSLCNLWVEYNPIFSEYYRDYLWVVETFGKERRFYARRDKMMPENHFVVSYMPWLRYTSFSAHRLAGGPPRLIPSVEWGKYVTGTDGKTLMPVTITVHHAAADGWHISEFFNQLQKAADQWQPQ